jgi:hypothetical protein
MTTPDKNYLPPELAAQMLERETLLNSGACKLDDPGDEALSCLAEEGLEVAKVKCKIDRFGMTTNPWNGKHNRDHLAEEIGDFCAAMTLSIIRGVVDPCQIQNAMLKKLREYESPIHEGGRLRFPISRDQRIVVLRVHDVRVLP